MDYGNGIPKGMAYEWGNTRLGYWRIANSRIATCVFTNDRLRRAGHHPLQLRLEQPPKPCECPLLPMASLSRTKHSQSENEVKKRERR